MSRPALAERRRGTRETISEKDRCYARRRSREVASFKGEVRIELVRLLSGNICMRYIGCGEEHFARGVGAVVKYRARTR